MTRRELNEWQRLARLAAVVVVVGVLWAGFCQLVEPGRAVSLLGGLVFGALAFWAGWRWAS